MQVDLLAVGAHPDDIEIGLGATVALHTSQGHRVGLCDLTRGELASNGTIEVRAGEAEQARQVLGAAWRENLGWPDGGITGSPDQVRAAAEVIRRCRPRTVAVPYWRDRHPDHTAAGRVMSKAVFYAGLRRFRAAGDPWRPEWVCYYFINDARTPSFVVDVSASYAVKRRALACHRSQFSPEGAAAVSTRLTSVRFLQLIESRDAQFGALAGVAYAEGIVVREPLLRPHIFRTLSAFPAAPAMPGPGAGEP
jgi:N-acetylglucosamine malate deacetylase 1